MMSRFVSFARGSRMGAQLVGAASLALLCAVSALADVTYDYDEAGRLRRATHDGGTVVTYVLDAAGNRTSVSTALGAGTVQLTASSYSGGEAAAQRVISVVVTRTGGNGTISLPFTITAGSATAGSDYSVATSSPLTWASGDTASKTITINVLDDTAVEANETLTVTLNPPTGGGLGTPASATVTIASDDVPPTGTVQLSAPSYAGGEAAGQRTITVIATRTGGSSGAVSLPFTVTAGSATAGSDYGVATPSPLTWANGDAANKTITISVVDDTVIEPNETLTVSLGTPTGAPRGTPASATVTITSDDTPPRGVLLFVFPTSTAGEGPGQRNLVVEVARTAGSFGAASISYTFGGGLAFNGVDYTATDGTLTWADGDTNNKQIFVTILDDSEFEGDETFEIQLFGATGAGMSEPSSHEVTIFSDDFPQPGSVQLSAGSYSGGEAAGQRIITVVATRTGGSFGAINLPFTVTAGSATAGSDYTVATGSPLRWTDGDAANKTITINVVDDTVFEPNETFTVSLGTPSAGTRGTPASATVTISSDDSPPRGVLLFVFPTSTAGEGPGQRNLVVEVARTAGSFGAASISYTFGGGLAFNGVDYTATDGTLNWADGDTNNKQILVTILDDSEFEGDETFEIQLFGATGAGMSEPSSHEVTIFSDDFPQPGSVQLSAGSYSGGEAAGQRIITVVATRTGGSAGAISLPFSVGGGSATAGSDYTVATGSPLSWANGDAANKAITINVVDDTVFESNETFTVSLGTPSAGTRGTPASATVTISSDDNPPSGSVQFTTVSHSAGEAAALRTVTLILTRTGGSFGAVSLPFTVVNGTATAGSDYTVVTGSPITWGDGDASNKSIVINIVDDSILEPNESVAVVLSNPSGATGGVPAGTTITIADNEPGIQISIDDMSIFTQGFQSATAHYALVTSGDIRTSVDGISGSDADVGDWINPKINMNDYEFRGTGGGAGCLGVFDTWRSLGGAGGGGGWNAQAFGTEQQGDCSIYVEIRAKANPSVVLDTANITISALSL